MLEGLLLQVTRFKTALAALCWMKRVVSLGPMLKLAQLMMAPGLLVIVRLGVPLPAKVAVPLTTVPPPGLATANSAAKQDARATAISLRRDGAYSRVVVVIYPPRYWTYRYMAVLGATTAVKSSGYQVTTRVLPAATRVYRTKALTVALMLL